MDDLLGQCRSLQAAYDTLAEVLIRIIKKNMTVSMDKFCVGTSVKYGGFILHASVDEPIKILPDPSKLQYLLDIPALTNKTELASFLGFVNTLKNLYMGCKHTQQYIEGLGQERY